MEESATGSAIIINFHQSFRRSSLVRHELSERYSVIFVSEYIAQEHIKARTESAERNARYRARNDYVCGIAVFLQICCDTDARNKFYHRVDKVRHGSRFHIIITLEKSSVNRNDADEKYRRHYQKHTIIRIVIVDKLRYRSCKYHSERRNRCSERNKDDRNVFYQLFYVFIFPERKSFGDHCRNGYGNARRRKRKQERINGIRGAEMAHRGVVLVNKSRYSDTEDKSRYLNKQAREREHKSA